MYVVYWQCALWKEQKLMKSKQYHLEIYRNSGEHPGLLIKKISAFHYTSFYHKSLLSWNIDLGQWISVSLDLLTPWQSPFIVVKLLHNKRNLPPKWYAFLIYIPQISQKLVDHIFTYSEENVPYIVYDSEWARLLCKTISIVISTQNSYAMTKIFMLADP